MARKFTYKKKDGTASRLVSLSELMTVAEQRFQPGAGPFGLTVDGEPFGVPKPRKEALARLKRRLELGDVGPVYRSKDRNDAPVLQCREAKVAAEVIDTSGNKKVDVFWTDLKAEFPTITFLGAYVCKSVSGSSTRSQHSYGNAVDPGASGELLNRIARWTINRAGQYCIRNVIFDNRIWSAGVGERPYTGDRHVSHMHVDFNPQASGACRVVETGAC